MACRAGTHNAGAVHARQAELPGAPVDRLLRFDAIAAVKAASCPAACGALIWSV
ncbi:hypothetical protein [Nonomuraea jabiensis]|uniref:hypothetical protein n=1 Tax=Nonomuraea jabiensis TaxID=882448 RepID=UPI003D75B056